MSLETPNPERQLAHQPAYLVFLFFLLCQLLMATELQRMNLPLGLILSEIFIFALPVVIWCVGANYRYSSFLSLSKWRFRGVLWGFLLGTTNFLVAGTLQIAMREILPFSQLFDSSKIFDGLSEIELVLLLLALGIVAPLCEEIAFRGYLQRVLQARYHSFSSVGITAVLFAALHLDPVGFLARVELGVLFGLLVLWSGSLWPAIAAHAANNGLAAALFLANPDGSSSSAPPPAGEALQVAFLGLGAALLVLALLRLFYKEYSRQSVPNVLPEPFDYHQDHSFQLHRVWERLH